MTRLAELESRAPELLHLDYRAHFQHITGRRHMQVRGESSQMGCPCEAASEAVCSRSQVSVSEGPVLLVYYNGVLVYMDM